MAITSKVPNRVSKTISYRNGSRELYYRLQSTDEEVIKHVLLGRQYDLSLLPRPHAGELFEFLRRKEAAGLRPLVVDAGANIGASAVYFTANMPHAQVIAIEPEPDNFDLLAKNVEGLSVQPLRAAISSSPGRATVVDPGRGHWGYRTRADDGSHPDSVPRITVNDIYASQPADVFPFIVKVDIEGGEMDLFSANTEWVERTPVIMVELHDWMFPKGGTARPFLQCVSKLDRDFIQMSQEIFSISNRLE